MIGIGGDRSLLEDDPPGLDPLDVPQPDDVSDRGQLVTLAEAHRRPLHHGRHDGSIGSEYDSLFFEAFVDLLDRIRPRPWPRSAERSPRRFGPLRAGKRRGSSTHVAPGRIQVIRSGSVPWSSSQQMASAAAVLPPPMITKPAGGLVILVSSPTGTQRTPSATSKGGGSHDGDPRRHIGRVDDTPAHHHFPNFTAHLRTERVVAQIVAHGKEANLAGTEEPVSHDFSRSSRRSLRRWIARRTPLCPPAPVDPVRAVSS